MLEGFGGRCGEITLDGQETSSAEMDKVADDRIQMEILIFLRQVGVLMALAVARDGKQPTSLFGNLPGGSQLTL